MKLNFTNFPRKCQFPLMLALGAMPLCTVVLVQLTVNSIRVLPVFLCAYVLLAWLCMVLPGKLRAAGGLLGCAALLLLGLRLLPVLHSVSAVNSHTIALSDSVFSLALPVLLCALLVYGLQFGAWPKERELSFNWCAVGVVAHLFGQFVVMLHRNLVPSPYDSVKPWLLACFIAYMPLMLLSLNRVSMLGAAQGRQRSPLPMRRRNAIMTLAFFALVLLVCAMPAIVRTIDSAWHTFLFAIAAAIRFIVNLLPDRSASGGMGGAAGSAAFGPMEAAEPSLLAVLLEKLFTVIVALFAVCLFFVLLRIIFRKVAQALRLLFSRMQAYLSAVSEDYVDEVTDTRTDGAEHSGMLSMLRERMAFVNEKRLAPAERIRYRYRRLLKKHADWHESRTARESLPDDPARRYERARYSGQEITPEEAEQFIQETRNL